MLRHGFHSFPRIGWIFLHHLKEAMNLIGRYLRSESWAEPSCAHGAGCWNGPPMLEKKRECPGMMWQGWSYHSDHLWLGLCWLQRWLARIAGFCWLFSRHAYCQHHHQLIVSLPVLTGQSRNGASTTWRGVTLPAPAAWGLGNARCGDQ